MIRLTFISDVHRDFAREYDTDDLAEALIAQAEHFRLHPEREGHATNRGPDTWIFAFIVERDDARVSPEEVEMTLRRIANLERLRGERTPVRGSNDE